jgi:hypothetical protein
MVKGGGGRRLTVGARSGAERRKGGRCGVR